MPTVSQELYHSESNLPLGDVDLLLSDARYELGQLWKKKFTKVVHDIRRLVEISNAWDGKKSEQTISKNPLEDGEYLVKKFEKVFAEIQETAPSRKKGIKRRSVREQIKQEAHMIEQSKTTNHVWSDDYCSSATKMMPIIHSIASISYVDFETEYPALQTLHEGLPHIGDCLHHLCKEVVSLYHQNLALSKAGHLVSQTRNMISVMGEL